MKVCALVVLLLSSGFANSQSLNESTVLQDLGEQSCACIDSISLFNRNKQDVISEISTCIDKNVVLLQFSTKLEEIIPPIDSLMITDGGIIQPKKENKTIEININENSQAYKDAYYNLERYLMKNCESLDLAVNSNEQQSELSMSDNSESLRYYELGFIESKDGNCEKAIAYYKEALRIDPNFAFAWDNIGICYRRLEKYDEAIEAYESSLLLDPYGKMPLQNIAVVYEFKGEYQKAIQSYERLGKVHPGNPEVYYGIARVYFYYLNDNELALSNLCKAYLLYIEEKSPYRSDAEEIMGEIFTKMEKQGQQKTFYQILERNDIRLNQTKNE